ncbi:MAG: DNA-directed RNA polymerase subunit D [Methanobacterium sp.]|jgi:DNA-directed RNA polymerase subunit D|nr:DNA-directed RNA polymerase subunit D [Methanobacterium sp.]
MEIEIKNRTDDQLTFIIEGVDVSLVNALRRICMMEVPTMAIERVEILKNDARIFDEALAHRLGMVPLTTDLDSLILPEDCDCDGHCPRCSVSLVLEGKGPKTEEKGPKTLYSGDLKSEDPNLKPVYDTIPLIKLKEGQEVVLEAIAQLGMGKDHAKWQPTTTCAYKYYPQITIDNDKCEACLQCVEECPRSVLEYDEKKKTIKVVDLENCSLCRTCEKNCQNQAITVDLTQDKFIFHIESDGSLSPTEILSLASDVLAGKADKIIDFKPGGSKQ